MGIKKSHTNEYKAKVVLAALREDRTMSELASEYGVHPITIGLWKKAVVQGLPRLFEGGRSLNGKEKEQTALIEKLYGKIGEIEVENDWIKKSLVSKTRGKMGLDFQGRNEESCMAVQSFGAVQIGLLLSTKGSEFGRYCADESHRRAIQDEPLPTVRRRHFMEVGRWLCF